MTASRTVEIKVTLELGPLHPTHDPARGSTFTGYSPAQVSRDVLTRVMQSLRAGERIRGYEVEGP